jgi:hypothetical protein
LSSVLSGVATSLQRLARGTWLRPHPPAGYTSLRPDRPRKDDVAKSHSRVRSWATIAAFTLIIALTVAEGVDEGFSLWDWLVIALGAIFILQALFRLEESRSAPS